MKEKQSCAVMQDLLPLYVEQLTSEETNHIIEEHLEECKSCKAIYDSMLEEILREKEQVNENTEAMKEVDYLKKIRTTSRKKVWFGIGGVLLAIVIIALIKVFVYGTPSEGYEADIKVEDGRIIIKGTFLDSASVYSHHKLVEKDGQKQLVVYAAVASMWNNDGAFEIEYSLEEAKEQGLVVDDQKITESGNVVSIHAAEIFAKKNPYVGDMSKNSALANVIGISEDLGRFTNELQTKAEPYGWTFHFQTTLEESNEKIFNEKMRSYAYVLLATVDNVSEITWSYMVKTKNGIKQQTATLTALEAYGILDEDIKSFGKSEERVEELLVKVGISEKGDGKSQLKEYKYRLTLTGRSPNAVKDSTFVVLTDNPDLTYEEVAKSLYSSNSNDWLEDTVIVDMK
jgi:hypothetical protein